MTIRYATAALLLCASIVTAASASDRDSHLEHARQLLREVPLIDGHNDVPYQYRSRTNGRLGELDFAGGTTDLTPDMHTDIPRLREGMVGGQFWSIYIPAGVGGYQAGDAKVQLEQIDVTLRLIDKYPDTFELARTADDVLRIHAEGKIASMMGMEGGQSIELSIPALRMFYELGARYMSLTHSKTIPWADSGTDEELHGGLTEFGKEVVREMNRLGMLIDLSHTSVDVMRQAIDLSEAPVIFSHSSARALCDTPRNVPDEILRMLKKDGGVVMVTFVPSYISGELRAWLERRQEIRSEAVQLFDSEQEAVSGALREWQAENPRPRVTVEDVADHIDHIRDTAGIDHIGLGSDYDGVPSFPEGLEDVSTYPVLIAELLARGYSDEDVKKVAGMNVIRAMRATERVAIRIQTQRGPSEETIESLDGGE